MRIVDIVDPFFSSKILFFVAGEIFKLLNCIYRFRLITFIVLSSTVAGAVVCALDSGASGPGSNPGRGHCVVFLGTSPPPPVPTGTGEFYVVRVTLRWTSIPSRRGVHYSWSLHATEAGINSGLMSHLAHKLSSIVQQQRPTTSPESDFCVRIRDQNVSSETGK